MRIAFGIEYDGSRFHGWQTQLHDVRTVQQVVEEAMSKVAAHEVKVVCAGRTDTGVHALGQVVHIDSLAERLPRNWLLGTNANLPDDASVTWVKAVTDDFHARFSATGRAYRYLILNRDARSSLLHRRVTWVHRRLDDERMHQAGQALVGTHDFSGYRALGCQAKSPMRELRSLAVARRGELIEIVVTANAFLHHMVRNIAGVLIAIGRGDCPLEWAAEVLASRDRTLGGVTAPSDGLYLTRVEYPAAFGIPTSTDSVFLP